MFKKIFKDLSTNSSILRSLETFLLYVTKEDQENNFSIIKDVLVNILKTEELALNPSKEIRICISLCFTECFKIFAPKVPLESIEELNKAFLLFSSIFQNHDIETQEGLIVIKIIKNLIETNSFLLLFDLDCFDYLFKILFEANLEIGFNYLVELMNAQDEFKQFQIDLIISQLLKNNKIGDLLLNLKIKHKINIFMLCPLNFTDLNSINVFIKLVEIFKPSIGFIIEILKKYIINECDKIRFEAIKLIKRIMKFTPIVSEDINSLNFLMSRHIDKYYMVRIIIISIAKNQFKNNDLKQIIIKIAKDRIVDSNESVRIYCLKKIISIEPMLFNMERLLYDKSLKIKKKAIKIICSNIEKENPYLIDELINLYDSNPFFAYYSIFILKKKFSFIDLFNLTKLKKKYISIIKDLINYYSQIKEWIINGQHFCSFEKYINIKLWNYYLPSRKIWELKDSNESLLEITNPEFVFEFKTLFQNIEIPINKILSSCDKKLIKLTFKKFPELFPPHLDLIYSKINTNTILSTLHLIADIIDKEKVIDLLINQNSKKSIICLGKLISKWKNNISISRSNDLIKIQILTKKININLMDLDYCSKVKLFKYFFNFNLNIDDIILLDEKLPNKIIRYICILSQKISNQKYLEVNQFYFKIDPLNTFKSFIHSTKNININCQLYRLFSNIIKDPFLLIRKRALNIIHKSLKNPKTSISFLSYLILFIFDTNKSIRTQAKKSILYHINLRKMILKNSLILNEFSPEMSIPSLLNLIIYHGYKFTDVQKIFKKCFPFSGNCTIIFKEILKNINVKSENGKKYYDIINLLLVEKNQDNQSTLDIRNFPKIFID